MVSTAIPKIDSFKTIYRNKIMSENTNEAPIAPTDETPIAPTDEAPITPKDRNQIISIYIILGGVIAILFAITLWLEEVPKNQHYWLTILVMLASGACGGIVNYYYRLQVNDEVAKTKELLPCIVVGIGASLVIPFLLSLMQSNIVLDAVSKGEGYITLMSWCLLAGVSGEPFITKMVITFNKNGDNGH
jgi:hypothetical protein